MQFAPPTRPFTGIAIPVAALRSAESCGVGDFGDLGLLGSWCREVGLDVIQLLPVNDTGGASSPYSALSAFALHPLYIRLKEVPGASGHAAEIEAFRAEAAAWEREHGGRFSYSRVLAFKLSLIERLYGESAKAIAGDPGFRKWKADNPWVVPYSVFRGLKRANADAAWAQWPTLSGADPREIAAWWKENPDQCMPFAWAQYLLENQLASAARALNRQGVWLKGDLPILMSTESADVWSERGCFDLAAMAGAPPDMFSPDGQNWGFPVYAWDAIARDGYRWWKARLGQAGKFFNAFRIDHVLGFFRIWRIPRGEVSGLLGRFEPSLGISSEDVRHLGWDSGRVRWLTLPHIRGGDLASLGANAQRVAGTCLSRIGSEDLYNILPAVDSEIAITALDEPDDVKRFLLGRHADRTLRPDGGVLYPAWDLEQKTGFRSLSEQDKAALRDLLGRRRAESEADWEKRGKHLLSILQSCTDMLVCAEDLGDVPRCVPRVLGELGILGLRILRWSRAYDQVGPGEPAPFIAPSEYPRLSVCTPSVHDTSTVRGWWREDPGERELFYRALGERGPCPAAMSATLLRRILEHCCSAASLLCMFQAQDLLDLDETLWSRDPSADRINIPGTVTDFNWTWRLPLPLEALIERRGLNEALRGLTAARRAGPSKGP